MRTTSLYPGALVSPFCLEVRPAGARWGRGALLVPLTPVSEAQSVPLVYPLRAGAESEALADPRLRRVAQRRETRVAGGARVQHARELADAAESEELAVVERVEALRHGGFGREAGGAARLRLLGRQIARRVAQVALDGAPPGRGGGGAKQARRLVEARPQPFHVFLLERDAGELGRGARETGGRGVRNLLAGEAGRLGEHRVAAPVPHGVLVAVAAGGYLDGRVAAVPLVVVVLRSHRERVEDAVAQLLHVWHFALAAMRGDAGSRAHRDQLSQKRVVGVGDVEVAAVEGAVVQAHDDVERSRVDGRHHGLRLGRRRVEAVPLVLHGEAPHRLLRVGGPIRAEHVGENVVGPVDPAFIETGRRPRRRP